MRATVMTEHEKTWNYQRHIMKDGTIDICRAYQRPGECLRHIVSGCSHLVNSKYFHKYLLRKRMKFERSWT